MLQQIMGAGGRRLAVLGAMGLSAALLTSHASAQVVQDRYLSRVEAVEHGNCSTITIEFNTPVQYQSHFPESHGTDLQISVAPLNFNRLSVDGASAESARPPRSSGSRLSNVQYDIAGPSGPELLLQFDRDMYWAVQADNEVTRILVEVSTSDVSACFSDTSVEGAGAASLADAVLSVTQTIPDAVDPNGYYAINLASTRGDRLDPGAVHQVDAFRSYVAYTYSTEENGAQWNRLRLGAFATRGEAETVLDQVRTAYPDAWIVRLDRRERDFVYRAWAAAKAQLTSGAEQPDVTRPIDPEADLMIEQARTALAAQDYPQAMQLARQVLGRAESTASPQAQEILGIAREGAGQLAHAKAEYEIFLQRYPDDPAADRVRQRLAVLLGGDEVQVGEAEEGEGGRARRPIRSDVSGSLSVLYQRDEVGTRFDETPIVGNVNPDPVEETRVNLNEMLYGADVSVSLGTDRHEALFRFSGLYTDDFRSEDPSDDEAISSLYLDLSDREWNANLRLGRQTRNSGGVFGRFDGAYAGYQATDRMRVNATAGFPVQSSRDLDVMTDRYFGGVSVDYALFADRLDVTVYALEQRYGDLIDRRAVGFEFRYFDAARSAYGIFDYDIHFNELNLALLNGSYRFEDDSSVNVSFDYRRAPFLTSQNAIIGQIVNGVGIEDPNDLSLYYTDDQIYDLARDRTAESRTGFISYTRPLTERLQASLDVIATNVGGTVSTPAYLDGMMVEIIPEIAAQPSTGTDFYYSAQLIASDFFRQGTIVTTGLRYADLSASTQTTFQVTGRYPVTGNLRLTPRFRIDDREARDGSSSRLSGRTSLKVTWTPMRFTQFELEVGGVYSDETRATGSTEERGYFLMIGARRDF